MIEKEIVSRFRSCFRSAPQAMARVPGRINLMGRHVDHQGGNVNLLTIDRHIIVAARCANGKAFRFRNVDDTTYPDFDFKLSDLDLDHHVDWKHQISRPHIAAWRDGIPLWTRYLVGAALRLCREIRAPLPGMEVMVHGNLPAAAGLSSSSALTLGFVLSANAMLNLGLERDRLIELTGEAEWFSGVIGGACAPAAMLSSAPGRLVRVGFFPFQIAGTHLFPDQLEIVLANSHEAAVKGEQARDEYNWRVATYRLAFVLLERVQPDWFERVRHLRDLDPETLNVPPAEVYRSMIDLPERISREEMSRSYPEQFQRLVGILSDHTEPTDGYPVRDILMYGLSEMARSARIGMLLDGGDHTALGHWITCSHDGDRVSRQVNGQRRGWRSPVLSNQFLSRLAEAAEAGDQSSDLTQQSGAYSASTYNVDEMVDLCNEVDGCLGAQIIGAGFGGAMIALVRKGVAKAVIECLEKSYFEPRGLPVEAWQMVPSDRAKVQIL